MKNTKKTFLLCLGTQKAGTSWLFDFIHDIDTVNMGYRKEYHVFDRLNYSEFLHEDNKALKLASIEENIMKFADLWKRLSMISNQQEYFDYFNSILKIKGASVTGDFTPEYSLLDEQRLQHIKNKFKELNVEVKVIFLMREPVERIWSANRMTKRVTGQEIPLLDAYKSKFVEKLTRYENIIPKINAVFSKNDLYINFYENLFQEKTITEILNFLNLPYKEPQFKKRVNESNYETIDQNERKIVEKYYFETYKYVESEFKDIYPWKDFTSIM